MSCAYQRMRSFFGLTRRKIFTVESLSISCFLVRALLWHASAFYKFEKNIIDALVPSIMSSCQTSCRFPSDESQLISTYQYMAQVRWTIDYSGTCRKKNWPS